MTWQQHHAQRRCLIVVGLSMCVWTAPGWAAEQQEQLPAYPAGVVRKLGRGAANVLSSPLEVLYHARNVKQHNGTIAGHTVGALQGVAWMGTRLVVGLFEVVTAPYPLNEFAPILQPEFCSLQYDNWVGTPSIASTAAEPTAK